LRPPGKNMEENMLQTRTLKSRKVFFVVTLCSSDRAFN
jgi:hypothetical protein